MIDTGVEERVVEEEVFIEVEERKAEEKPKKKNNKVQRHKELCIKLNKTYEAKNHDYGDSFGNTYKQLGIASALVRISDKYNRLMSLGSGKKQMVNDESLRDTLMDMANYCLMTVLELDREAYNKEKFNNEA